MRSIWCITSSKVNHMATHRPRITVTLTEQVHDTLSKLAELQGRSMSSIILEHLELVEPVHQKVLSAIVRARRLQEDSKTDLLTGLQSAQEQAEAALLPLLGLLDGIAGKSQPPSCNTGVTSPKHQAAPAKKPTGKGRKS